MREILFRGKNNFGVWLYGDLLINKDRYYINERGFSDRYYMDGRAHIYAAKVIPETVGQHIGLEDRNGVKIFEGDIITFKEGKYLLEIIFEDSEWVGRVMNSGELKGYKMQLACGSMRDYKVIGNIYDNTDFMD